MVKDFNINVVYQGKSHLFQCLPKDFISHVSKYYEVNRSDIEIYSLDKDRRRKITWCDLVDLMKVEIVLKGKTPAMNDQSPTSSGDGIRERLVNKLTQNNSLSGSERKYLIDLLVNKTESNSSKRKLNFEESNQPKRKMINKLVQCKPSPFYYKTTFSQTDKTYNGMNVNADDLFYSAELAGKGKGNRTDVIYSDHTVQFKNSSVQTNVFELDDNLRSKRASRKKVYFKSSYSQTDEICIHSTESEYTISEIKRLAVDYEKNKKEIEKLMDATFDDRRHFILMKSPLVSNVREKYPALFSVDEVKKELDRLFYTGKCDEFFKNVAKYSETILDECGKDSEIYSHTFNTVKYCFTEHQKLYAKYVGSVLGIPFLVNETLDFINTIDNQGKSDIYPYIDASKKTIQEIYFEDVTFTIIVEGQLLCQATSLAEAILCFVASFFIFDIGYTESCKNTLIVFEKLYLHATETRDYDTHTEQMIKLLKLKAYSES